MMVLLVLKEKVHFQVTASVFTLLAIALERHRAVITPLAPRCFLDALASLDLKLSVSESVSH